MKGIGRSEEICVQMNHLAQEHNSYVALRREREQYNNIQVFSQRSAGSQTTASREREDYQERVFELRKTKEAVVSSGANYPDLFVLHSSSKGSDSGRRSNNSRKDKTGGHLPTGTDGKSGAHRCVI